jgi:hypothetical protein
MPSRTVLSTSCARLIALLRVFSTRFPIQIGPTRDVRRNSLRSIIHDRLTERNGMIFGTDPISHFYFGGMGLLLRWYGARLILFALEARTSFLSQPARSPPALNARMPPVLIQQSESLR